MGRLWGTLESSSGCSIATCLKTRHQAEIHPVSISQILSRGNFRRLVGPRPSFRSPLTCQTRRLSNTAPSRLPSELPLQSNGRLSFPVICRPST